MFSNLSNNKGVDYFSTIDYFSLDVEGSELPILRSIPFKRVKIKVFSIEVAHSNKSEIRHHMEQNGYILIHEIPPPPNTFDQVYVLRDEM